MVLGRKDLPNPLRWGLMLVCATGRTGALLRQHGYHYVLGRGVRRLPARWHDQLFDQDNYATLTRPEQRELKMLELPDGEGKIIVTHSETRARHDAEQRAKLLDKLRWQIGKTAPSQGLVPKH